MKPRIRKTLRAPGMEFTSPTWVMQTPYVTAACESWEDAMLKVLIFAPRRARIEPPESKESQ